MLNYKLLGYKLKLNFLVYLKEWKQKREFWGKGKGEEETRKCKEGEKE